MNKIKFNLLPKTVALLILNLAFLINGSAQCPEVDVVIIDACTTAEALNEFVIINSGSGFNTSNLYVDFAMGNNLCASTSPFNANNDINTNTNNCSSDPTPCGITNGNILAFSNCSNLISIGDGYDVPPNSFVVFQMSSGSNTSGIYNLSALCGMGQCVYVVSSSCVRANNVGAFTNSGSGSRTYTFGFSPACEQIVTYNLPSSSQNGASYLPETDTYVAGNNTSCPLIPVEEPAPPSANVDQPTNVQVCSGDEVDIMFTGTATTYSWTNSNTSIGLGASGTGNINFTSAVVTSTQVGTIVVTPMGACPGPNRTFTITVTPSQDPSFTFNDWCEGDPNGPTVVVTPGGMYSLNPNPGGGVSINSMTGVITGAVNNVLYTVQYTTPGPCPGTQTTEVMQLPSQDASFTFNDWCQGDPNGPTGIVTSGGTFSLNPNPGGGVSINSSTGVITGAVNNVTYTVQYTTPGPCPGTETTTVMQSPSQDASFTFNDWCQGDPNGPTGVVTSGGSYTLNPNPGGGVSINTMTGVITGAVNNVTYTVQYTTPGPCPDTETRNVMQIPAQNAAFTFANFCVGDPNGPVLTGAPGGMYSFNPPSGNATSINSTTGEITNEVAGSYTVQYTTNGPCPGTSTVAVTVTNTTNLTPPALGPFCTNDSPTNLPSTINGITGNWSGPGVSANTFNPNIGAGSYTLTFMPDPNQCAASFNTNVSVISSPTGSLTGTPTLCPGQCDVANFSFSGGSGTFNLTMNISAGPFNFNFPMLGVSSATTLTLCLSNSAPPFNPATNTLNIPTFVPPGTYTLTLLTMTDANGGPCANGVVNSGNISLTIGSQPPANDLSLTLCDLNGDGMENFNLSSNNSAVAVPPNTIMWYSDPALTNLIANPASFSASDNTVVYAQVTSTAGCENVAEVTLNVDPPQVIQGPTINGCANGPLINLPTSIGAASGGTWSGLNLVNGNTQFDPTGLTAGSYNITYTPPAAQCIAPIIATVVLGAGAPIVINTPFALACVGQPNIILPTEVGSIPGVWSGTNVTGNTFTVTTPGPFLLTFTPSPGQCFTAGTTQIIVSPTVVLTPPSFLPICSGGPDVNLPTSVDGYSGDWTGVNVVNNVFDGNAAAGNYLITFNPDNPCASSFTSQIIVQTNVNLVAPPLGPTCVNGSPINLPTTLQGITGSWTYNATPITVFNPATFGIGSYSLVFTPAAGSCANILIATIAVGQIEAGANSTIKLCLQAIDTINLNTYLSPNATVGGAWTLGGVAISDPINYDISQLPTDTFRFRYRIADPICGTDSAFVTFITSDPNNAGSNSNANLCQSDARYFDFTDLITSADNGGFWVAPSGFSIDFSNQDSVNLSSMGIGTFSFLYIVGNNDCPRDTSTHSIQISPFNSAGTDDASSACIGSTINLLNLINTTYTGGVFLNPNAVAGLTGSSWNSTGLTKGTYRFEYVALNTGTCINDTALITIMLDENLNAGVAQGAFYCEDQVLVLEDYIVDPNASRGGKFFTINGVEVPNGIFDTKSSISNIVFYYIVGDGVICQRDTALYTFTRVEEPNITFNMLSPICETDCTTLKIDHNMLPGTQVYLRLVASNNQTFNRTITVVDNQSLLVQFCGASIPPYNFGNLRPNLSYTVFLDSIISPNKICNFDFGKLVDFSVRPLNTKLVERTLCKGSTLTIGGDVYSETKPSGTSVINVPPNIGCDTVVTVDLNFIDVPPPSDIRRTTCNQNFSITIGTRTFNRANPSGQVILKNIGGCDSIINVNLTFVPPPIRSVTESTCDQNKTYTIGGQTFSFTRQSGQVVIPNGSVFGCDSTINVTITYLAKPSSDLEVMTCDQAYSVTVGNQKFDKVRPTGSVTLTGAARNGCDSIVNVKLSFVTAVVNPLFITTCDPAYKITVGNQTFDMARPLGQVILTNAAASGCDSIVDVDIKFTDFLVTNSLVYDCDDPMPTLNLNLANQPGPYSISLNGQTLASNQSIPYSTKLPSGNNVLIVTNSQGCKDTISLAVSEQTGPVVTLTQTALNDGFTQINTVVPNNTIYDLTWTPSSTLSCNDCFDPIASPGPLTTYILTYFYGTDCIDSTSIIIEAFRNDTIVLPNIISLNSNSANSTFYVQLPGSLSGKVKSMRIYDRWGNMMFLKENVAINDPSEGWDAKFGTREVESGVYIYVVELEIEGKSDTLILKGDLTVIK